MFPNGDVVIAEGLPAGVYDVKVLRGGTLIGQASDRSSAGGELEINHLGGSDCYDGQTPDILPGDVVQVLRNDTDTGVEMTVANVTIDPLADAGDQPVTLTGTAVLGAGQELLARLVKGLGDAHYEAPGDDGTTLTRTGADWTATFPAAATAANGYEARVVDGGAVTIATPDAENACGAPASTAMTALSRNVVNLANQDQPITASGVIQDGQTVSVRVPGGPARPGIVSGGTWTAVIPVGDLTSLPNDQVSLVTAEFTGGGAPGPQTLPITRDVTAPAAPSATPGAGTYASGQSVTLSTASSDASVLWTNTAGEPATPFSGPIAVTASQTLNAVAVDDVGNRSGVESFRYVIGPAGGGGGGGGPATIAPATAPGGSGSGSFAGSSADLLTDPLALSSLATTGQITRGRARSVGLRLVMRLQDGTEVVQVRVYRRLAGGKRKLLSSGFRSTNGKSGLFRMRQNHRALRRSLKTGRYVVEVTPGASRTDLGRTASYNVRVVR